MTVSRAVDVPQLFDKVPSAFFRPLGSPLCELYWEIGLLAYHLRKDANAENPPITKSFLLDRAEDRLLIHGLGNQDFSELESEDLGDPVKEYDSRHRRYANLILRKLERCKWFSFEFDKIAGDNLLRLEEHTWRIVPVLEKLAKEARMELRSLAYPVRQALTNDTLQKTSPEIFYAHLQDAAGKFLDELKILDDNIGHYIEEARRKSKTKDLLAFHTEYQQHVVQLSYTRYKTIDNVHRYRGVILNQLDGLILNREFLDSATQAVANARGISGNTDPIRDEIQDGLLGLAIEFRNLENLVRDIDERNRRCIQTTLYRMRHDLIREESIVASLARLVHMRNVQTDCYDVQDALAQYYQAEFPDADSLYTPPNREALPAPIPQPEPPGLSMERRNEVLQRMLKAASRAMPREKVYERVRELLAGRDSVNISEIPIENDEDMVYLISLHVHKNRADAPYRIHFDKGIPAIIRKACFTFRECEIKARKMPTSLPAARVKE